MSSDILVSAWYEKWMEQYKKRCIKESTAETYGIIYRRHIEPAIGTRELSGVNAEDLQSILNGLCDRGYSAQMISMAKIIMNGLFRQAYQCELTVKNPCEFLKIPRGKQKKETTVFTKEEEDIFLKYCRGSALEDLFRMALYTGMRGGELRALQWEDIDLKHGLIHIRHTLYFQKGSPFCLGTPKSPASIRDIPMLPVTKKLLEKRQKTAATAREGSPCRNFVFTCKDRPIPKGTVSREILVILEAIRRDGIDFPYFTLHTMRHSFATRCMEAGMKPKVLQKILGHASLAVTMDTYVKVMPDEKAEQMKLLEGIF